MLYNPRKSILINTFENPKYVSFIFLLYYISILDLFFYE
jgi:hypothetical protein